MPPASGTVGHTREAAPQGAPLEIHLATL